MKHFRLLFLTVVLSAVCATASAQRVTLDMQNAKLEKVLGQITQQTGLVFNYTRPTINPDKRVSVSVKQAELESVLRQLFDADGIPLRAELKVTLTGYCSRKEEEKHFSKHSPDVSRMVTLNEGQTLSALCYEIYGDELLVGQVARFNNLNGYRNIPAGTQLLMPILKKG